MNYSTFFIEGFPSDKYSRTKETTFLITLKEYISSCFFVIWSLSKKILRITLYGVLVWGYMGFFQSMNLAYNHYEEELYSSTNDVFDQVTFYVGETTDIIGSIVKNDSYIIMTSMCLELYGE